MNTLKTHQVLIKRSFLLIAPLLLKLQVEPYKSMSFESLSSRFVFDPKYEFFEKPQPFEERFANETIFIKIEGSKDFEIKIRSIIGKMKIRSKFINISRNNSLEHYFIKIYLKEGNENCYNVYPLKNYQTNTELVLLGKSLFEYKLLFRLNDLIYSSFENSLDITLKNDNSSVIKLCNLLRYFLNFQSHNYGLYYYLPTGTGFIRAESFGKFILLVLIILCFDLNIYLYTYGLYFCFEI